jgi:hypothetical protein
MTTLFFPPLCGQKTGLIYRQKDNAIRLESSGGFVLGRRRSEFNFFSFQIAYQKLTSADVVILKNFYEMTKGGAASFFWTNPINLQDLQVRFESPPSFQNKSGRFDEYAATLNLEIIELFL